jgi:hypothetical protein
MRLRCFFTRGTTGLHRAYAKHASWADHPTRRGRRPGLPVNCPNMVQTELSEYHLWAWRKHLSVQVGVANAGIRTGAEGNRSTPLPRPLLSSKCKFGSWDSRSKPVRTRGNCASGASRTETGATYQSGCSTSGELRWIRTSAGERRPWQRFPAEIVCRGQPTLLCRQPTRGAPSWRRERSSPALSPQRGIPFTSVQSTGWTREKKGQNTA